MNKRKLIALLVMVTQLTPKSVLGALPMIRAEELTLSEYQLRLGEKGEWFSYIDFLQSLHPNEDEVKKLHQLFDKAQMAFIKSSLSESIHAFKAVTKMEFDADWNANERKMLAFSFFRLADLNSEPSSVENIMEQAVAFAPDIHPDPDVFKPTLVESWNRVSRQLNEKQILIKGIDKFPNYEIIKIDGKSFPIGNSNSTLHLLPGTHRVSGYSNSHPFFTQILTGSQLQILRIDQTALVSGDCEHPGLKTEDFFANSDYAIAYTDCTRVKRDGKWLDSEDLKAPLGEDHQQNLDLSQKSAMASTRQIELTDKIPEKLPEPHNRWLIYGLAAVAVVGVGVAGYMIYQSQNHSATEASTKEGF